MIRVSFIREDGGWGWRRKVLDLYLGFAYMKLFVYMESTIGCFTFFLYVVHGGVQL